MPQNAGRCALPALLVFSLLPNWQQQGAKVFSSGNSILPAGQPGGTQARGGQRA